MQTPFLNSIVVSRDGTEHLMIRAVLSINREHYAVFIPLVSRTPCGVPESDEEFWDIDNWDGDGDAPVDTDEDMDAEWVEMGEGVEIEPISFGRIVYDYENLQALIEPLFWKDEPEVIDRILATLHRLYT